MGRWGQKVFDEEEQTPPPPIPPVDQRIVVPGIGAPRTQANVNPQGWENRIKEAQARLDAAKAALGDKNDTRSTLQKALALKEMEREVRNAKKDSPGVPTQEVIDIAKDSENTIAPDGQVFKKGQNYSTGRIYKNEETGNLEYKKFAAVPTSQVLKGLAIPWGGAIPPIPEDPNQGATPGEKEPWYKAFGEGLMDPVNNLVIGGMNLFNPDPNTAFVPSRSTLRPELQNEYPYMGGSIAGNLALAVPGANIAGTAARGIGLGAGTANVAAGALTGAAMTAPGAYNQAASKAMTPGEAITSTVLGGVGGGTASAIGGALAKKGVGLTTNLAGQAAGDFGVGFGTPFVQAAVNNNELPTIKTAAIQGGVNALTGVGIGTATVFGTGLSNLLNGQKRSNAKAAANNAAAAEVNAQKAAASAEEAKTQTQATAYGQTAATFAKGAGGGDLNAVIGVAPGASPAEAYNTLVGFVQSATNGTVPNRPTEVVKTIKNVMQNGAEPGSKMYQDIVAGNIEGYNLDIVSKTQEKYNSDLATKVKVETTAQLPRIISDAYTTLQQAGIQDLNPNQAIAVAQILTGGKISNAEVAQKKILEYAVGNKSTQSIADGVAAAAGRAQLQSELKTQQAQQSLEQKANTAASKQKEKEGKVAEQNTKALLSNLGVPMPKGADQNLIWQNVAAIYNKDGRFADLNAFVGFAGKTLNDAQSRVGEMGDAEMSDLLLRGVGKVGRLPEIELRNKIAEDMLRTGATADEAVDAIRTQKTPAEQKEAADTQKAAQTGGETTQPVTSGMIGGGNPGMIYEGGTPPPKSGDYTPGLEAAPVDAPVTVPEAPQLTPHTQALVKSGDGYTVGAPLTGRSQGSLSQLQKTIAATGGQEAVDAIINDSNLQSGLIAVSELQPAVLNKLGAEMGWDFTGMNDSQKRAFVLNKGIETAEGILDVGEVVKGFGSKAKDVDEQTVLKSMALGKPIDLDATFGTRKNKPWEKFGIDSSTGTFSQGGRLWTPNNVAVKNSIIKLAANSLTAGEAAGEANVSNLAALATKQLRQRTKDKTAEITAADITIARTGGDTSADEVAPGVATQTKAPTGSSVSNDVTFGIKDTSKPSEEGWTPELEADIDAKFDLRFGKIDDPTNRKAVNEAIVNLHNDIEKMFGGLGPDWVYNRTGALLKQFEQKKNSSQQTDTPAGQSSEPTPEITKVDAIPLTKEQAIANIKAAKASGDAEALKKAKDDYTQLIQSVNPFTGEPLDKPKRTKSRPGSGEPPQKSSAITTADVLLAGIGAYSLYHALAFGDASGLSMAALAAGANSDMVKKGLGGLKQKTSDWIKSYNLKGDSINSAYNTWVQNNSYADEAAKKQALSDIKEQSALRLEGLPNMAFDLNPFHQIAAKNSILGGIRDKGFEMEKHFSGMSTILDDINTWIKKTQQDLVSEVVKLNSDVYNANAAINNDNSIPKDQKAEAKEEATSALLSEAFAKNPELQAEYEKWRNMINEASALQIELQMLNDISAVPSTLDARIDDFTKVADELQFQADDFSSYANNIGKMLRTDKAGAFDKLLVNDMEFRTLYSGKKTVRKKNRKTGVVTEEELDDKNKILIVKKHQKEQRKKANALRRKQRATERMANYHEELEKRKAQSVADHHINLWRAYQAAQRKKMFFGKGRDLQSATLQLRGADGKRYRIYGNNKKSVVEQTASIAGKEGLVMEVEGFALSPTATVDQLSKGWMPKGAIFKDSDGNVWDFNQFAAAHDDYTNTLWSAIDLVTAGIAESKLAKVTAEWLKNNPEQAGDSGELKALRSKITEAAEGRIDAEELRTNLLVMQAQQATEPPKTSTLMPPGTEDGNLAQHIANGLHDLQNDAYRTGRAVGTREQLMTDALEGWDDKLNSYLRRQQEQLATRAAVPFGRNLLTEGMNSLTSASQLLLLALRPATFAVNLVKGTTMSASEFGLGDVMRQLPGFKIDGFNAAWEHAKKTVDTQTANRYYVGEADRGGWVKSVLRGSTAWSQAIADKVTARTATADFVANLSDADAKLLAGGDKGMLRKLDNHVLNSIAMTQGRYQHYDLSPVHQQILRFPMGRAALAFTLPRINELSWVWQNAKNMKDRKSQAKLLRYGMLTAMTVGGLGLPLVADLMSALNSGTGDREELATDKAIADLRKLAIENGVDGETFDNIRKFGAKGAPGALLDTELMSDEETSSLLTMFMVENLIKVGKNIAGNLTDEEKTAAEKILAITEGSMPQLKAVRRTATEASTGTKTDSKGDLIPGSSTDAGRMTQIFLGLGSHTDRQAQKRLKNTDLVTEQGLNKAAENFLDDLQGMSQIIYAGKIINSSKKEANADRRDELFKHITKNKEELRNVIRTANELTEQAEEKIKEAGEKLKSWLKTPVSEVKGLPKRVVEQGGTVEEAMNRTLAISRNPSYNSTKGVVKRMVGSMEDEKYSETSLYGFYRKKAIIEAVNNSKLGVKAYFNPTTKVESGGRLKNVPDAEQAFEYGKNRVISLLQGQVLPG